MERIPIFQMKLGIDAQSRVGWYLADEFESSDSAPCWAIPHLASLLETNEFVMMGEDVRRPIEFSLRFKGNLLVDEANGIRFSLSDPAAPNDFRGLPFVQSLSYIGEAGAVLEKYGVARTSNFLALTPLDLIRMDALYLEKRVTFVGVTRTFGPHGKAGFRWRSSAVKRRIAKPSAHAGLLGDQTKRRA